MDTLLLFAMVARLRRVVVGRAVRRVVPAGDDGVRLDTGPDDRGLRLLCGPGPGALLFDGRVPPRVHGGRGAWPDIAGAADARLTGRTIIGIDVAERPPAVAVRFDDGSRLVLRMGRNGGLLTLECPGDAPRRLPRLAADDPVEPAWIPDLDARAGSPGTALVDLLRGEPCAVTVRGPAACLAGAPRASCAGRVRVDPGPGAAGEPGLPAATLEDGVTAWFDRHAGALLVAARRSALVTPLARESARCHRAHAAVEADGARSPDPAVLRRAADALLAAGRDPRVDGGHFVVPDPYGEEEELRIAVDPPGAKPNVAAERLYGRARRAERGIAARAARLAVLDARAADTDDEIVPLEERARRLGLGVALGGRAPAAPSRTPRGEEGGAPRAFRSPGGFEVLVGRSAAQNDRLTFAIAGPDDLWLHARGHAGAHVVLRQAGRGPAPPADVAFAARLAAAYSQAAPGETIDVIVALRKHVRKPKGAAPGAVTVRKERVLRTRAEPPPAS